LLVAQRERLSHECVLDLLDFVDPTIGAVTPGLCMSQASDLRGRNAGLSGNLCNTVDDRDVEVCR
jgi:hypothetical protein